MLAEIFWREYISRFGEPKDIFDSLGYSELEIELTQNNIAETSETFIVKGRGFVANYGERHNYAQIKAILKLMEQQYNIKGRVVRRQW